MTPLSWALAVAWVVAIFLLIHDMTEWSFKTDCLRTRQRRTMITVLPLVALTLFALWTVLLPQLEAMK